MLRWMEPGWLAFRQSIHQGATFMGALAHIAGVAAATPLGEFDVKQVRIQL